MEQADATLPMAERSERLAELLRAEMRHGPIPFARFMEVALYHPDLGYYEGGEDVVGRRGDFVTSVSVGSVFGELLACYFCDWREHRMHGAWQIVEGGAHDGQLALDILNWLRHHAAATYDQLEYWLLEPSPRRRTWQAATLAGHQARVRWARTWEELPAEGVTGVVFANELLDAMPVHRLAWNAASGSWLEWGVGATAEGFRWERMPLSAGLRGRSELLPSTPPELARVIPDGYATEVSPLAAEWWQRAATALRAGQLMTLDYGCSQADELAPWRPDGTLRAYRAQAAESDVLEEPGERDLTAHVHFGRLCAIGEKAGLRTECLTTQGRFFVSLFQRLSGAGDTCANWSPAERRQLQTLIHPGQFGQAFKVLVQTRDG